MESRLPGLELRIARPGANCAGDRSLETTDDAEQFIPRLRLRDVGASGEMQDAVNVVGHDQKFVKHDVGA